MVAGIINLIVIIAIFIVLLCIDDLSADALVGIALCLMISTVILTICLIDRVDKDMVHAIDVYRGNTELEITQTVINDSVVEIDTVVVWKK